MKQSNGKKLRRLERRIGNYHVVLHALSDVPVIDVKNLEGTWMVRIPVDYQMFGMLNRLLLEAEDDDTAIRSNAHEWLSTFFMNWQNVTGIPNGHYHQGVMMLTACYADPGLLKNPFFGRGRGREFAKSAKALRASFLKWAAERDSLATDMDMEQEAVADGAKEILKKDESDEE